MEELIKILMDRDGISRAEAISLIKETKEEIVRTNDAETPLMEILGLEPDYIMNMF